MDDNYIGKNIKRLRTEQKRTLKEMADYIGIQEATAQRYESGNIKNIPYEKIVAISNFLGCNPQEIMGWEKELKFEVPKYNSNIMLLIAATKEIIDDASVMQRVFDYIDAINPKMEPSVREAIRKYNDKH